LVTVSVVTVTMGLASGRCEPESQRRDR
jgi:hypothetical protein